MNYRHGDSAYLWEGLFFSRMTDLIIVAPNPDPTKVPIGPISQHLNYFQNIGSTDVSGLVLGADMQLGKSAFGYANYALTHDGDGDEIDNISQHKLNAGVNIRAHKHLNANLRLNWRGQIKASLSNLYYYPKEEATVTALGYSYETETDPDGFLEGHLLVNATFTGMEIGGSLQGLQPQLIVRNLLGEEYLQMGRQSGSGARPAGALQPEIQNPSGFIPPYHPQPGREILLVLRYDLGE